MARRRSTIARRIAKIRGLPADEKQLLLRVGDLIDAQINNRTPANPFEPGRVKSDPRLPPPTNVTTEPGIKTSKLSWPAVDSSILSHYEILVRNLDTGLEETFISYTNIFFFKGRVGGNYSGSVRSVGRNGTKSPIVTEVEFFVPENVMLIEGSKNGFNTVGTIVSEDLLHFQAHKIFAWGAFTLDKLIGNPSNPVVSLQLLRSEAGQTINDAVLIETITMEEATLSATCADDTLFGGISRPALSGDAASDPTFVRGSTFETSQSTMFSPIEVTADQAGKTFIYYLRAIGREAVDDVISLSLTLWSASAGQGDQVPSIPIVSEPPVVFPDLKAIELNSANMENEWLHDAVPGNLNFFTNNDEFTVGFWIKLRRFKLGTSANVIFTFHQPIPGVGDFGHLVNHMGIPRS